MGGFSFLNHVKTFFYNHAETLKIADIKLKYINEQMDLYHLEIFLIITEAVALKRNKHVSC